MSARSRYLDAISPKSNTSENEFSTTQPVIKPSINIKNGVVRSVSNTTNTSASNSGGINRGGQQQQLISPSNLQGRNRTNNSFNSSNNYTNTNNNTTNNNTNTANISTRNKLLASAPPPPPPPGPPPKRVSSSKNNRPVIKYTGDPSINNNQVAVTTVDNNNNESSVVKVGDAQEVQESVQSSSPAKKGGSIWSPKNEVQSGSVKSMTKKLWGGKVSSPKVRLVLVCFCLSFAVSIWICRVII